MLYILKLFKAMTVEIYRVNSARFVYRYYLAVMVSPCNSTNVSLSIGNFGNFTMPPVNYTFFSYTGTCKFFNKTSKKWSNEGLDVRQNLFISTSICPKIEVA